MKLRGYVCSGLGRAHIFMAQSHYQNQFKKILGFTAWPGTLNVKVDGESLQKYVALRTRSGITSKGLEENIISESREIDTDHLIIQKIEGFERDGSSFGGATTFTSSIGNEDLEIVDCAVLIPDLTRHIDVVEVISSHFLREKLGLENGDVVEINCKIS